MTDRTWLHRSCEKQKTALAVSLNMKSVREIASISISELASEKNVWTGIEVDLEVCMLDHLAPEDWLLCIIGWIS